MHQPLVSILIPLYNAQDYIEETIESCLDQTYSNIEIIIVDDHSNDYSYRISEKYVCNNVFLYKNNKKGGCSARNLAFQKSKGEYIQYLDADDLLSPDKILRQIELLERESFNPSVISFSSKLFEEKVKSKSFLIKQIEKDYQQPIDILIDFWKYDVFLPPHSYLFHRDLQLKAGGWNEELFKNQDGEFFARIINQSNKLICCQQGGICYRDTANSVSKQMNKNALRSLLISFEIVTNIILSYRNDVYVREIIAKYFSSFLYNCYPENKFLLNEIEQNIRGLDCPIYFPNNRKSFKILRKFIGWKAAKKITSVKEFIYVEKKLKKLLK